MCARQKHDVFGTPMRQRGALEIKEMFSGTGQVMREPFRTAMTSSRVALSSMPRIMRASSTDLHENDARARLANQNHVHLFRRELRKCEENLWPVLLILSVHIAHIFFDDDRAAAAPAPATPAAFPSAA